VHLIQGFSIISEGTKEI